MVNRESLLFVGGVDDPEMRTIERLVTYAGCRFVDAIAPDKTQLKPENAYNALLPESANIDDDTQVVTVETGLMNQEIDQAVIGQVDHHNAGDFGYDKPPAEAWAGSSIGQTTQLLSRLGLLPTLTIAEQKELRTYGAMDHCLAAAIQGKTPGVRPYDVMALSMFETARSHLVTLIDTERCMIQMTKELERSATLVFKEASLLDVRHINLGSLYSLGHLCMNLASASIGRPAIAELQTDVGMTQKIVLVGGYEPCHVEAFLAYAADIGLENIYAVPRRGVAGGYLNP